VRKADRKRRWGRPVQKTRRFRGQAGQKVQRNTQLSGGRGETPGRNGGKWALKWEIIWKNNDAVTTHGLGSQVNKNQRKDVAKMKVRGREKKTIKTSMTFFEGQPNKKEQEEFLSIPEEEQLGGTQILGYGENRISHEQKAPR